MENDVKAKRTNYIDKTSDSCELFKFAHPEQILEACDLYCGDYYGAMLWQLNSEPVGKYFRCFNTMT